MLISSPKLHLLDSNIVIYLFQEQKKIMDFIEKLSSEDLCISTITRTEVLMETKKEHVSFEELTEYLDFFEPLPLTREVADYTARLYLSEKYPLKFKDLIIASTAIIHKKTLITADKAFQRIEGLKCILLEV